MTFSISTNSSSLHNVTCALISLYCSGLNSCRIASIIEASSTSRNNVNCLRIVLILNFVLSGYTSLGARYCHKYQVPGMNWCKIFKWRTAECLAISMTCAHHAAVFDCPSPAFFLALALTLLSFPHHPKPHSLLTYTHSHSDSFYPVILLQHSQRSFMR